MNALRYAKPSSCPWPRLVEQTLLVPDPSDPKQMMAFFALPMYQKKMNLSGIPLPPSSNNSYATIMIKGFPRRVKAKELKLWELEFDTWVLFKSSEIRQMRGILLPIQKGKLIKIDASFYFHRAKVMTLKDTPKKMDVSNRLKHLHDKLAEALGVDDCLFFDGSFQKRIIEDHKEQKVDVKIELVDAPWLLSN